MQLLGALFQRVLEQRGERLNVLGATSGDTGSAAEYAMRGRDRINVFMLSPNGRMSEFQRAQMYSLTDANIFNVALEGVFDDCQDIVKGVAGDLEFKQRFSIGSVNSINWGRVVAQVVYYFKGYLAATRVERAEGVVRGTVRQLRQHPVGLGREADGVADRAAGTRDERKRRARRIFSDRALPCPQQRRDACDQQSVDGHFESVEFRALHFRSGRARQPNCCANSGGKSIRAASFTWAGRRSGLSSVRAGWYPAAARTAIEFERSARRSSGTASSSIRIPLTASKSRSSTLTATCR